MPTYTALLARGMQMEIIVREPFIIPELPIPATALPIINIFEEVETPHSKEPSSKRAKNARYVY
jgi:hypothetical protein